MHKKIILHPIKYTGAELHSLWIYEKFNLLGDSIVAFSGECEIDFEKMIDLEDVLAKEKITSTNMLHFIIEHFERNLEKAILRQYLSMAILKDILQNKVNEKIIRKGNNLYEKDKKITVSIATLSPVSSLIHIGINIDSKNTPILTKGLEDYNIDWQIVAKEFLDEYIKNYEEIKRAKCKVRGAK
ncbi:MAG: DUF366 family protein [bacterium]